FAAAVDHDVGDAGVRVTEVEGSKKSLIRGLVARAVAADLRHRPRRVAMNVNDDSDAHASPAATAAGAVDPYFWSHRMASTRLSWRNCSRSRGSSTTRRPQWWNGISRSANQRRRVWRETPSSSAASWTDTRRVPVGLLDTIIVYLSARPGWFPDLH